MAFFQKIKEAFVKSNDKDKYLSGLNRSKKSFGDRIRVLSNNFPGIDDELLEEIMVILLESDVGIHTAQKIVDAFLYLASAISRRSLASVSFSEYSSHSSRISKDGFLYC